MLKQWPAQERPREKLLNKGAESLSDAELLAIFLRTGCKGCHVVELSRQLLAHFGSLTQLLAADCEQFCHHKGLGQAKYVQLQACLEMSKRFLAETLQQQNAFTSSETTKAYLVNQLSQETREIFAILLLNNQHQIIHFERLFLGTLDSATVHPRIVVEQALNHHAAAVILSHNHPSGVSEPSLADQSITQRLISALQLVDIRVLDHIIVAGKQCYSFSEHGLL